MRLMWWSNAPWVPSGYGVQTKLFVPRLVAAGHEVAICANAGLQGGTTLWNGVRVFPGWGAVGNEVIGHHSRSWEAEITISLFDAWVVQPQKFAMTGMRWVPWFPVDSEPVQPSVLRAVRNASQSIVFSKFGERICLEAGLTPFYVPHGVDTAIFRPGDRRAAREQLGCPPDSFVLGMVAANRGTPSRKSIPQVLEAFARFSARRKDAILYLHTSTGDEPWAEGVAIPLAPLIQHFGLSGRVIVAESYSLLMGCPDAYMANLYNCLDGLVAPSMGEGFGVPILEAQACGCPVLVGDWTSMSELCFAGHRVARDEAEFFWTDLQGGHMLPHVAAIERGMDVLYERRGDQGWRQQAAAGAARYDADRVTQEYWAPTLGIIGERVRETPQNRKAQLLLQLLATAPPGDVAEVGCLRSSVEVASDGNSTAYLAKACRDQGRRFSSCDRDPVAVDVANSVLVRSGLKAAAVVAEGSEHLRGRGALAMLYLDSSDDPRDTLSQLACAELAPGGVVAIDDAQFTDAGPFGKATLVVQHCTKRCVPVEIVATEPGFLAAVLRFPDGKAPLVLP